MQRAADGEVVERARGFQRRPDVARICKPFGDERSKTASNCALGWSSSPDAERPANVDQLSQVMRVMVADEEYFAQVGLA